MTISDSFWRDANRVPITTDGLITQTSKTLVGSAETAAVPIFTVTGSVEIRAIWGVITTNLGTNHTAAHFRINDQTAQPVITAASGTTLSSKKSGSIIVKKGLAGAAVTLLDNAAGIVSEPTTLETTYYSPFVVVKKTAALTQIEYVYTTSEEPTSGAIQFFVRWLPLSADASVAAV